MKVRQIASGVLMIRPAAFGHNAETALTNRFQRGTGPDLPDAASLGRAEFDGFLRQLRSAGVQVCVLDDAPSPARPDAVFPNNWISFHEDGTVVLYPLAVPSRRLERRDDVVPQVVQQFGLQVRRVLDLTGHEAAGRFLEGTGSLVLDRVERIAFACRSPRTDPEVAREWARELAYDLVLFDAHGPDGLPPYHTNVMLWIGTHCAGVCMEAIATVDRARVLDALRRGGRDIVPLSLEAMTSFAGNMLEIGTWDEALGDATLLVMSARARSALDALSFAQLRSHVDEVLVVPVPTIETLGGGSVRCMLAEIPFQSLEQA